MNKIFKTFFLLLIISQQFFCTHITQHFAKQGKTISIINIVLFAFGVIMFSFFLYKKKKKRDLEEFDYEGEEE